MARRIQEESLQAIREAVGRHPEGATAQQIADALEPAPARRTLQYRLKFLVDDGLLVMEGEGRWAKYRLLAIAVRKDLVAGAAGIEGQVEGTVPLSKTGAAIQAQVCKPLGSRKPVGYNREFLDLYRPNESFYLTAVERKHLREVGTPKIAEQQPAGTYAKQILNRLLIDLSWNSSRLEGNTYSLLDTRRLIDFDEEAEGKQRLEAQMILNHKDAIEFLIHESDEISFNRYTILNLHAMLANNLLADAGAAGRLRHIGVGIERSVFHPLEVPQQIEACFDQILMSASAITNPFEQAFFVMVQFPYLQPFDDVNKRVSRLSANIPLFKENFVPLSFEGVPRRTYTEAVLGVYELNKVTLLKDIFIWAYERSADRYAAIRQSLGEPDPFRMRHRMALGKVIRPIIRERMEKKQAATHLKSWTQMNIDEKEREQFREIAENELLGLHEGNFARYQIRPSEFTAWREIWNR